MFINFPYIYITCIYICIYIYIEYTKYIDINICNYLYIYFIYVCEYMYIIVYLFVYIFI